MSCLKTLQNPRWERRWLYGHSLQSALRRGWRASRGGPCPSRGMKETLALEGGSHCADPQQDTLRPEGGGPGTTCQGSIPGW